ncbi:SMC-Scp complex subunit ScpB [Candidatus Bathyarchaeota archaeon]|nr:SMC-Scp complex subunit ScpB [Candidatus Bathyarchaeota archaeon]
MAQTEGVASTTDRYKTQVIEGALYVAGKPLDIQTLGSVSKMRSEGKVRDIARSIVERYKQSETSLEVLELQDGRFVMQLKPEYVNAVRKLATRKLLTPGPLKTLSFIALKQPVTQSYVVRVRGKLTYQYVKQLEDLELVSESKLGRTKVLRTTRVFSDYFNLSQDTRLMKRQLERLFKELSPAKDEEKGKET